jgi:glycosyltransferase involved in cell wall biosynthesis
MQQADVLVLPSIVEGRALVIQEAMMCGLPVIITPNTGASDLVLPGQTGFTVPIRDPQALAEAISWCADNRQALPDMGQQAVLLASSYPWTAYAEGVLAASSQVPQPTPNPGPHSTPSLTAT